MDRWIWRDMQHNVHCSYASQKLYQSNNSFNYCKVNLLPNSLLSVMSYIVESSFGNQNYTYFVYWIFCINILGYGSRIVWEIDYCTVLQSCCYCYTPLTVSSSRHPIAPLSYALHAYDVVRTHTPQIINRGEIFAHCGATPPPWYRARQFYYPPRPNWINRPCMMYQYV